MALMLRSLASSFSSERTPLPCIDPLPLSRSSSRTDGGKVKRTPEPVRASPYPPLKRSSPGFGSGTGARRLSSVGQPLKRTTSLHGGDSLASLQTAATEARQQSFCKPPTNKHRRQTNGPLRPALSLANTLVLDPLVCPPPIPIPRNSIVCAPVPIPPAPKPPTPTIFSQGVRRRSSLAPEPTAPTALIPRTSLVPLPSPPSVLGSKKKRESLAQRTLRRQFERTPRGAQVKALGAHAAVRMMSEAEEEAAVAAVVVVEEGSDSEDVCMVDSWVEVAPSEEMEWSIIDGSET